MKYKFTSPLDNPYFLFFRGMNSYYYLSLSYILGNMWPTE